MMERPFVVIIFLLGLLRLSNGDTYSNCDIINRIDVKEGQHNINVRLTSYGYRYRSVTCQWNLRNVACGGSVITATVINGANYVSFYDGSTTSAPRLYGYTVKSTGKHLLVRASLGRYQRLQVTFKYEEEAKQAEFNPKSISSVGFPNQQYENNLRCTWNIVTTDTFYSIIKITLLELSLESEYDYLRIYDGSVTEEPVVMFTGDVSQGLIYSTGPNVVVVFTSDKQNTAKGFKLTYQKVVAVPSISQEAHQISEGKQEKLSVSFVSITPHLSVYWQREDDPLVENTRYHMHTARSASYGNGYYEYETTLTIDHVTEDDYGAYLVSVENSAGFAEHSLTLQQPISAAVFGSPVTEYGDLRTSITVTFTCSPEYTDVQWWRNATRLQSKRDSQVLSQQEKYVMDVRADVSQYIAQLTIISPNISDYGWYKVSVINKAGASELKIKLNFPQKYLPVIPENYLTTVTEFTGNMSVDVSSKIPITVSWGRDGDTFKNSSRDTVTLKQDGKYEVAIGIPQLALQDFGAYELTVANEAGTSRREITFTKPAVFPSILICNQSKSIDITCVVKDCDTHFHPWLHIISDTVVRRLPGTVEGHTNTLTINRCGFKDAGTYICQTEEEDKNGIITSKPGYSAYLTVNAVPFISANTSIAMARQSIEIKVPVVSHPPLRRVYLFRQDREPVNGYDIGWNENHLDSEIGINIHDHDVQVMGTTVTVSKRTIGEPDYATYHIGMMNDVGYSNFSIEVENPREDVPNINQDVSFYINESGSVGSIMVIFYSFPKYESVVWERNNTIISSGNKYRNITRDYDDRRVFFSNTRHFYVSQFNVSGLVDGDYTTYTITVKNAKGSASIRATMPNPDYVLPRFLDKDVQLNTDDSTTKTASLSFNFTSQPTYKSVEWTRNGEPVDSQRCSIVTEAIGTDVEPTVFRSTLNIPNPTSGDEGNYTLAVTNKMGVSMESLALALNDCTNENKSA